MLFKASVHVLVYSSVLFSILFFIYSREKLPKRSKRDAPDYTPKCRIQTTAIDRVDKLRTKRFVLFPEFVNYLGDYRYSNLTDDITFWTSNFYPDRVDNLVLTEYIKLIMGQINSVIGHRLTIREAANPGETNFHYDLFDYAKCPMDADSSATTDNVLAVEELYIYSVELTRASRYRANGGVTIRDGDRLVSSVKLNMQQNFIAFKDAIYDPVIYTCTDNNECDIDLYWTLLHETLHGFAIEHTTNAEQPTPPNPKMQSVMHFSYLRFLCHDDIRAIRMIYKLPVKRDYNVLDDTCRRDFPMSFWQKFMYLIDKLIFPLLRAIVVISGVIFLLTLIYILLRSCRRLEKQTSTTSNVAEVKGKRTDQPRGYLWHDEML